MEHRSAMHALGARQKVHGFTLRKPQSDRLLGCVKMYAEQKWPRLPRYFEASTFDAFRVLSSKLKISNVRELGHEFSHSLDPKATVATGGFPASETPRKLGCCDVKLGRQSTT